MALTVARHIADRKKGISSGGYALYIYDVFPLPSLVLSRSGSEGIISAAIGTPGLRYWCVRVCVLQPGKIIKGKYTTTTGVQRLMSQVHGTGIPNTSTVF
jgi:hypothetical protein